MLSSETSVDAQQLPPKRIVSGGADNKVKIWSWKDTQFALASTLSGHTDWVRDVAWCNNLGLKQEMIATCSEDMTVKVWKKDLQKEQWS